MYRRRRITVLVLALVVIVLLVVGITLMVKAVGKVRAEAAQPDPVEEVAEPQAPGPEGDAASGSCPAGGVALKGDVNAEEYPKGEQPEFTIEVQNTHSADCLIDVGTEQQEFLVRHEGDTVWSSRYCRNEEGDRETAENRIVFPAQESKKTTLVWNRIPVDDSCHQAGEDFAAGEYELVVKLGDIESDPVPFTLRAGEDEAEETGEPTEDPSEQAQSPTEEPTGSGE
ncbi:hypothetical protein [Brevibacterium album]|uniref:hypothetical protein n=1 Tax=Brevibacterium album TaxID=417948 RepID=UPI00041DB80D|nr:hypothetical protein [Brevibacterium album]